MAKGKVAEVLVDEITIPKSVRKLTQDDGNVFHQQVGTTYFKGDKVPVDEISPPVLEALEDSDHRNHDSLSKKLKLGSGEAHENLAVRLGLPFDGYDDMDEEDILDAMRVLPSPTVVAIQTYERQNDNRDSIVTYNIGYGINNDDYVDGNVGSDVEDGQQDAKAVSKIKTRRVTDTEVEAGEGFTGTGDPQVPYGTEAAGEKTTKKSTGKRRGRRTRSGSSSGSSRGRKSDTAENPGELTGAGSADAQGTAE